LRSRQEPRRVSNGVIIGAMLLLLCVLSIVKARYYATPFGTDPIVSFPFSVFPRSVMSCCGVVGGGAPLLTSVLLRACRQGGGPAPRADERQHPDGDGGVAGQDARR
jgi:hypothetical protein